jgi:DNA-binding response OmpR family regulator
MVRDTTLGEAQAYLNTKTILLVEDDQSIGEVLKEAIVFELRHFVIVACNAFEALKIIKEIKPDLLILDYQLPHMDGLALYDQLHTMTELAKVPALMISALLPYKELAKRGITGMSKPIELDDFFLAIEKLLY